MTDITRIGWALVGNLPLLLALRKDAFRAVKMCDRLDISPNSDYEDLLIVDDYTQRTASIWTGLEGNLDFQI